MSGTLLVDENGKETVDINGAIAFAKSIGRHDAVARLQAQYAKLAAAKAAAAKAAEAAAVKESLRQYTAARKKEAVAEAERQAAARNRKKKDRARKRREADIARAKTAKKKGIRAANISAIGRTRINQDEAAARKRRTEEDLRRGSAKRQKQEEAAAATTPPKWTKKVRKESAKKRHARECSEATAAKAAKAAKAKAAAKKKTRPEFRKAKRKRERREKAAAAEAREREKAAEASNARTLVYGLRALGDAGLRAIMDLEEAAAAPGAAPIVPPPSNATRARARLHSTSQALGAAAYGIGPASGHDNRRSISMSVETEIFVLLMAILLVVFAASAIFMAVYLAVLFGSEDATRMAATVAPMAPVAEPMAARTSNGRRTQLACRELAIEMAQGPSRVADGYWDEVSQRWSDGNLHLIMRLRGSEAPASVRIFV